MGKIRKALAAGVGAFLSTLIGSVVANGMPGSVGEIGALLGTAVALGAAAGWAAWRVPNTTGSPT